MSVCSSHADIDSKLMTVGLRCFYRRVAVGLVFDINFYTLIGMGIPLPRLQTRLSWVKRRKKRRLSTNKSVYLGSDRMWTYSYNIKLI